MNEHAGVDLSIDGFERGEIDLESFDHEAHLHLAWLYLEQFPLPEALERFDAALRRLTARLGIPGKYHATITWFYLLLIGERRDGEPGLPWNRFRIRNADLLDHGGILNRYYHRDTLASERARRSFILPDRVAEKAPGH